MDLCKKRDNIPHCSLERIEQLKKLDPIFLKRHKQYILCKACNTVPQFDPKDLYKYKFIPKFTIKRKKEEIIKEKSQFVKSKTFYQLEMEQNLKKSKDFIHKLNLL